MNRISICISFLFISFNGWAQDQQPPKDSFYLLSPVEVKAIRLLAIAPFSKTNISAKELSKSNLGQDLPFLLNQTASVVVNSDAGNGVGYTGIRIRGTDATRINITLNGIPYNDAESQGTFFVDLPDLASSTGSIQIQRGVGSSTNGAGSFGGSINFSTNEVFKKAYASFNNSDGSFATWKNTLKAGTGLLGDHFTTDLRLSCINSNGFIDRASSDLKSFYLSSAYTGDRSSLRFNLLLGKEKTYQAWYGISQDDLDAGRRTLNYAGTEKPGSPYDNETDNYRQNHYQLFFNHRCNEKLSFSTALFLTSGKGYYEQYKAGDTYTSYNIPVNGISDFIRQLWLDNDFFGNTFSILYKGKKMETTLGGSLSRYNGKHFGELVWASQGLPEPRYRWYDLRAHKTDWNIFLKQQVSPGKGLHLFYDLQFRPVRYTIHGFRDNPSLQIHNQYNFFNPKAGISYVKNAWNYFISAAFASKEPNRDDFEAGMDQQPQPEHLFDLEAGTGWNNGSDHLSGTIYYMHYKDQLVLSGKINDVGAYTRTNIPESYRLGIELEGKYQLWTWMNIAGNITFSQNKVLHFSEFIDDYDMGGQQIKAYKRTDIAYSPSWIASSTVSFSLLPSLSLDILSKYVSRQYLDNTGDPGRSLDPFYVQDLRLEHSIHPKWAKDIQIIFQVNNLFNNKYEPNGYTYNYIYGGTLSVNNYYFPMAGINFIAGINLKF